MGPMAMTVPLNDRKKMMPPTTPVTVINYWWNGDSLRRRRPEPEWPDMIDFLGEDVGARKVWFGTRQERIMPEDL